MYICMKCNRTFADPATIYDDIGYKYSACPYCEDDRIEESEPCKQCSDPKARDHEDYCDSCKGAVLEAVIPYGTEVIIDGQAYVAEDTGGAIKGNHIDIFTGSHQEAINRGRITREVWAK